MSDTAKDLINQGKPWKADVRWQVVAIEAVLLIAIGLFMVFSTDRAGDWILQIIGLVFLIVSVQLAVVSFRNREGEAGLGVFDSFRAGIGVTIGVIATSLWWSDYVANSAVRLILGWGLVAFAILHLVGLVIVRGPSGLRPATLVLSGLTLVLGVVLLTSGESTADDRIRFLGVVLLVFGVLLGGLAYLLMSRDRATTTTT